MRTYYGTVRGYYTEKDTGFHEDLVEIYLSPLPMGPRIRRLRPVGEMSVRGLEICFGLGR